KVGKDKGAKKQKDAQADATSSDTAPEEGADKTAGDGASGSAASASSSKAGKDKSEGAAKSGEKQQAPEKIITDSDRQEFNRNTGKFEAFGHVRVKHGDIVVNSNKLQLVYGTDNKPESAVFTGKVVATQQQNRTEADMITYFLSTKRIQATGNVRSKVVQQKKADATKKGGLFSGLSVPTRGEANTQTASNSQSATDTIIIWSDAQDYSEGTGRVEADGNVKLFYEDTVGVAPKVILVRNPKDGQAEKVVMSGRCQITQPGKRWIADRITFTMADNRVLAEGNTKAFILQKPSPGRAPEPQRDGFKVAGEKPTRLGATKIETAQ
ncbi:MAG TPA: LptA/OstA family protein, partial [Candidatus Obscuribacterales bacterium]